MAETKVFGWRCPWSGDESDPPQWSYRVWFWLYRRNQIARHWFGIHQKPTAYSIAPRCDWCGHRSAKQRAIARSNRAAPVPHPAAVDPSEGG